MIPDSPDASSTTRAAFRTTHWSLVAEAGDAASPQALRALEELCRAYWPPIYAEIRRRGHAPADAKDLTQEFFARLLRRESFGRADRHQGRFRSFLLAALDHFLADQWREKMAQKRGGGVEVLPLDLDDGETWLGEPVSPAQTPEAAFDQRWAVILMDRALHVLREEHRERGRADLFAALHPFLATESGGEGYYAAAAQAGMSPATFTVAVHRFRQKFREAVRRQVAMTVACPDEEAAEMRHLFGL